MRDAKCRVTFSTGTKPSRSAFTEKPPRPARDAGRSDIARTCGQRSDRGRTSPNAQRCQACGEAQPGLEHNCTPTCLICGDSHLTGSADCAAKFRHRRPGTVRNSGTNKNTNPRGAGNDAALRRGTTATASTKRGRRRSREPGPKARQNSNEPASSGSHKGEQLGTGR